MFTGIIQQIGKVQTVTPKDELIELQIRAKVPTKPGGSLSVDGACLTVTKNEGPSLTVEAIPETQQKTIMKNYREGTKVNLETSLRVGGTLDGHFVTGHIDFVGTVTALEEDKNSRTLTVSVPPEMTKFFALKGSAGINGVSLTVSNIDSDSFTVSLIPETLKKSNLGSLKKNDHVNVEIDLVSRYLDSLLKGKEQQTSYEFLKERGFL